MLPVSVCLDRICISYAYGKYTIKESMLIMPSRLLST